MKKQLASGNVSQGLMCPKNQPRDVDASQYERTPPIDPEINPGILIYTKQEGKMGVCGGTSITVPLAVGTQFSRVSGAVTVVITVSDGFRCIVCRPKIREIEERRIK